MQDLYPRQWVPCVWLQSRVAGKGALPSGHGRSPVAEEARPGLLRRPRNKYLAGQAKCWMVTAAQFAFQFPSMAACTETIL